MAVVARVDWWIKKVAVPESGLPDSRHGLHYLPRIWLCVRCDITELHLIESSFPRSRRDARSCRTGSSGPYSRKSVYQALPGTVWIQFDSLPAGAFGPKYRSTEPFALTASASLVVLAGEGLARLQFGPGLRIVDHYGPEVLGRRVGGDVQLVDLAPVEIVTVLVRHRIGVLRSGTDHLLHHGRRVDRGLVEEQGARPGCDRPCRRSPATGSRHR